MRRFVESVWHTLVYTALSVAAAAAARHARGRGVSRQVSDARLSLRGLFILPMMATPVAHPRWCGP